MSITFYWNTSRPVCLHIVYGYFHAVMAELGSYTRDRMAYQALNIHSLAPLWKKLLSLMLEAEAQAAE